MKFRAEPKDILIFVLFCLLLLYLIAIAILNVASLSQNSVLHGFNPLPAFTGEFFAPTIVFFLVALISIIASVSSYFFERESGFGISTTKKDKGYSRWAKPIEMKKELKPVKVIDEKLSVGGVPLINDGKIVWVDDGEYHNLIIGATGSGKTQGIILPTARILGKHGESMIITDPKGEIYEKTYGLLQENGYNIVLLNFREPANGNSWNPLTLPYQLYKEGNVDKAIELLDDLAMNILYEEKSGNADPFWEKTSADFFSGLALGLFEDATEEQININSINLMATIGEEKFGGSNYLKEYFELKDKSKTAYINASGTINAPTETKGSILSVFRQKVKLFASRENLSEMLSYSDFNLKDIGRKKTAVFIVIQDEKKTYHSLATIFIKQCYETLIDVAQENGGKLPFRTNFLLDEFANMPPLKDVTTMVTAARSRNIRFSFIIQNFAQLYQVYGKENGETIKGNCGNLIYLISSELSALEEISKLCGEVKSKEKDKTVSTPLVTVSDLQRLKQYETIIIRTRLMPFKTKLTPDWKIDWARTYEKGTYPHRNRRNVQLFDIKEYTKEKKKSKLFEILDEGNAPHPGMMPNPNMSNMPNIPNMPPFMGGGVPSGNDSGFNVDDLVKRIDAKIAELEEEERREKEAQDKLKNSPDQLPFSIGVDKPVNNIVTSEETKNPLTEVNNNVIKEMDSIPVTTKVEEKLVQSQPKTPVIIEAKEQDNHITDDQFFDDFFSDE